MTAQPERALVDLATRLVGGYLGNVRHGTGKVIGSMHLSDDTGSGTLAENRPTRDGGTAPPADHR